VILTYVFEVLVEVITSMYARFVGRPWQRRRAERLIKQKKVRCILFDADEGVLPRRSIDGVAEVSQKRLSIEGVELWVRVIEGAPDDGPIDPFSKDGTFHPPEGDLTFRPRTSIYRLRLHNEATVRWSVLAFQAEQAVALLGLQENGSNADVLP
jgi:hypothetical protein